MAEDLREFDVEEIVRIGFKPPKEMEKLLMLKATLIGYGAPVRYDYSTKHGDYYRTKIFVSAPKSNTDLIEYLIKSFGGKIEEKEILTTKCYRDAICMSVNCVRFPIGVSDLGLLVGVELPSKVVVAGDERLCLGFIRYLAMHYMMDVGSRISVEKDS